MISWVVLANTRVELTLDSLRAQLDRLYPGEFLPPRDRRNFVVDGLTLGAQFLIQSSIANSVGLYMLHSVAAAYTDVSNFADGIDDPSLRQLSLAQEAWLSVDLIESSPDQDCYSFIGRLLAELAPPDAAVLVHPGRRLAIRFDDRIRDQLARDGFAGGLN